MLHRPIETARLIRSWRNSKGTFRTAYRIKQLGCTIAMHWESRFRRTFVPAMKLVTVVSNAGEGFLCQGEQAEPAPASQVTLPDSSLCYYRSHLSVGGPRPQRRSL